MRDYRTRTSTPSLDRRVGIGEILTIFAYHCRVSWSRSRLLRAGLLWSIRTIHVYHVGCCHSVHLWTFFMRLLEFQLIPHRKILLWSGNRHLPSPFSFIHHINFTSLSKGNSPVEIKSILVWRMSHNFFPGLAAPSKQFLANPTFPDLPAWHIRHVLTLGPR